MIITRIDDTTSSLSTPLKVSVLWASSVFEIDFACPTSLVGFADCSFFLQIKLKERKKRLYLSYNGTARLISAAITIEVHCEILLRADTDRSILYPNNWQALCVGLLKPKLAKVSTIVFVRFPLFLVINHFSGLSAIYFCTTRRKGVRNFESISWHCGPVCWSLDSSIWT